MCVFGGILTIRSSVASWVVLVWGVVNLYLSYFFHHCISFRWCADVYEVLGVGDLKDLTGDLKIEVSGVGDVIFILLCVDHCRDSYACWKRKLKNIS